MEESFPRGGRSSSTTAAKNAPLDKSDEKRQRKKKRSLSGEGYAAVSKKDDFLFGEDPGKSSKKKKRKHSASESNNNNKHSLLPLGGGGVVMKRHAGKAALLGKHAGRAELFIEALGFSRLAKGTKLLGIIREVQEEFALVSLPNLLTGYILRSELGDDALPLTNVVSVGQVMAVVILQTSTENVKTSGKKGTITRRRIQVSIEPSALNVRYEDPQPKFPVRGKLQAIEDNGMVVDLGHGRKGFLAFADVDDNTYKIKEEEDDDENYNEEEEEEDDEDDRAKLQIGSIHDFIVKRRAKSAAEITPLSLPSTDQMAQHKIPTADMTTASNNGTHAPSIQSLSPGLLVGVKVEALARNGLCVTFAGEVFRGAIELAHLGGFWIPAHKQLDGSNEWKQVFESGLRFMARILAVDAATKMIRLTVQPHLMDLRPPTPTALPPPGTLLENATVIRLDVGVGALLALPFNNGMEDVMDTEDDDFEDDDNETHNGKAAEANLSLLHPPPSEKESYHEATKVRAVYVHISKAFDAHSGEKTEVTTFSKEFAPSTKHSVRILSTSNLIEGVASGASAPSILHAHVLTYSDLTPGKIFRQVPICAYVGSGAVLVEFGMEIRGLITSQHLFDHGSGTSEYRSKMLKAKYPVGSKVDVRVISTDVARKQCFLTAKKQLVQASSASIISSYNDCRVGKTAVGYISKVDDAGLFVTFFNRVFGRVTSRSLALELGIDDHRENYHVGDVVQCRIVNIKKVRRGQRSHRSVADDEDENSAEEEDNSLFYRELTLSLRVNGEGADDDGEELTEKSGDDINHRVRLRAGAILPEKSMKVVKMVPGKLKGDGTFVPGYAIVSVKSKYLLDEKEKLSMLPFVECKLSFDNLFDHYQPSDIQSVDALNALAEQTLKVGKKLKQKGVLLTDPGKSKFEYASGVGRLTLVSVRPQLVELAERQQLSAGGDKDADKLILPSRNSDLFEGATVLGYVAHIDQRHGAFVRFLDCLTGLVPRAQNGLDLDLFSTLAAKIISVDHLSNPPKILLSASGAGEGNERRSVDKESAIGDGVPFRLGDSIAEAEIESVDFHTAHVQILDKKWKHFAIKARMHCAVAASDPYDNKRPVKKPKSFASLSITELHPFYGWKKGDILRNLRVIAASNHRGTCCVDLTNHDTQLPSVNTNQADVPTGSEVSGIVRQLAQSNGGVFLSLGPKLSGYIPGVECSKDTEVLNQLSNYFPVGARIDCTVLDKLRWRSTRAKAIDNISAKHPHDEDPHLLYLSRVREPSNETPHSSTKPARGDLVVGRIQRSLRPINGPALMLDLRGGFVGRCCITELEEPDEWLNMPLGHTSSQGGSALVSGDSDMEGEDEAEEGPTKEKQRKRNNEQFSDGKYVQCRVLSGMPSRPLVEVSLRSSRIEGDLDEDEAPEAGEMCHAFVCDTNKRGCFLRVARTVEGRCTLKELSDEFLPNPEASFPTGRLVVGKVKHVKVMKRKKYKKTILDLDMRESTVLQSQQLQFSDIELNSKHKGTVTRVENYGAFVRLENSAVSGLVHKSECSDKYIKNLQDLYDPGDLVKVLVIKKDEEAKQIGFSMKASHFVDDVDSDDDSMSDGDGMDEDMSDGAGMEVDEALDSDDEDFGSKLQRSKFESNKLADSSTDEESSSNSDSNSKENMAQGKQKDSDSKDYDGSGSDSGSESSASDEEEEKKEGKKASAQVMDTDVGFDWNATNSAIANSKENESESDSDTDTDDVEVDGEMPSSSSHRSRKKQAQKRREEQEIFRRETALADGTADENPETAADFERLLSGSPNSSEIWIRYMAFHLSLADVPAAREVAERAFARIEFREEREKLNVWSALLTLEMKYGNATSLQATIDQACQHNNPKQVYLRVCEMVEKEANASLPDTVIRADEYYNKMCKKFKSKKKVWIAHLQYLLKSGRHKDAHDLLRRSLKSLPHYKHVETMSKFAQLEFEFGSPERARTVFDGVILKNPKRLDLVFVYADKEVKHGSVEMARSLFEKIVNPRSDSPKKKLSDKQMKSLFKKWYKIEEEHGTAETQEHVKDAAKSYVERTTTS